MLFKSRPKLDTPMDHFLNRDQLSTDERAILDVYLMGVTHALRGVDTVLTANGKNPIYTLVDGNDALGVAEIETIVGEFLDQRQDMKGQPLGLAAVMAVLQRFPA